MSGKCLSVCLFCEPSTLSRRRDSWLRMTCQASVCLSVCLCCEPSTPSRRRDPWPRMTCQVSVCLSVCLFVCLQGSYARHNHRHPQFPFVTAGKCSCGKVMFLHLSVILFTVGGVSASGSRRVSASGSEGCTPLRRTHSPGHTDTHPGQTHPSWQPLPLPPSPSWARPIPGQTDTLDTPP